MLQKEMLPIKGAVVVAPEVNLSSTDACEAPKVALKSFMMSNVLIYFFALVAYGG